METIEFELDGSLYAAEAVLRAVHRQSGDCAVELNRVDGQFRARLTSRSERSIEELRRRFMADLVDEQLREDVASRTSALRDVLMEAALREARPRTR